LGVPPLHVPCWGGICEKFHPFLSKEMERLAIISDFRESRAI
jgi:hypothetical protein